MTALRSVRHRWSCVLELLEANGSPMFLESRAHSGFESPIHTKIVSMSRYEQIQKLAGLDRVLKNWPSESELSLLKVADRFLCTYGV